LPASDPAVGSAFGEAALRGVPLIALHACAHPVSSGAGDMLPLVYDPAWVEAAETRLLSEAPAGRQRSWKPGRLLARQLADDRSCFPRPA
jgi:hypothetical protein